jgi:hypothetical protein
MANVYVTGPVHIYVNLPGEAFANVNTGKPTALTLTGNCYYLGTGEQAPSISFAPVYEPVPNDIAGSGHPTEYIYQGRVASISCTLTRWNESVIAALDTMGTGGSRGIDNSTDVGTAMSFEGMQFCTWLHFPYYSKAYGSSYGMPAGYRFFGCRLVDWQISPGTRAKRRLFAVSCDRVYDPATGASYLFDNVMTYGAGAVAGTAGVGLAIPATPPTVATGLVS